MDIKDLDFKELLQKPVEETFLARHLQGQLSSQELESVAGGSQERFAVETGSVIMDESVIIDQMCFSCDFFPYYICLY